jgi:hypothetical protein
VLRLPKKLLPQSVGSLSKSERHRLYLSRVHRPRRCYPPAVVDKVDGDGDAATAPSQPLRSAKVSRKKAKSYPALRAIDKTASTPRRDAAAWVHKTVQRVLVPQ